MKSKKTKKAAKTSMFSWVWFILAACFAPFIMAQSAIAIAGWVALLLFLRFSRTVPSKYSLPAIGAAIFAANTVAFRNGFVPGESINLYTTAAGIAVAYVALFAIDKVLWRKLKGALSTFVFPLASTAIGFLATLGNPVGTAGSEAYSQSTTPIAQLAAFAGIWGVVFMMAWFASVFNAWWEVGFSVQKLRRPLTVFGLTAAALIFASATQHILIQPQTSHTVLIAGIAPPKLLNENAWVGNIDTHDGREASRDRVQQLNDYLFEQTRKEAQRGAKIVVWSEAVARIVKDDEPALIARGQATARELGIYLQMGVYTLGFKDSAIVAENRAVMITPEGKIAWDYHKSKPTPGDSERPGEGTMPYLDTPYGRIATIICQDDLFPQLVAQAGRNDVDILLVPSNDWPAIAEWHTQVPTYRAIENGVSVFRPTGRGISLAVDYKGRELARTDGYTKNNEQILRAAVPTKGVTTVYPVVGDFVAYGSVLGITSVAGYAWTARRKNNER